MKNVFLLTSLTIILIACESKETKINKAKETVMSFVTNLSFDNYELMFKSYPSFVDVKTYWKLKDFNIINAELNENTITVVGKSQNRDVLFEVEKIANDYQIIKSKGLSSDFDSDLYKYCKQIGCIGISNYDSEVSKICKEKEYEFSLLVRTIKETIEDNVVLENHNITKNDFGYAIGDLTIRNNSRFTIPGSSYELYVNYKDSKGGTLFTSKEILNFEPIPFGQGRTIHVIESNAYSFKKVDISLRIISTKFIEYIIANHAEGINCNYSDNL